MKKLASKVIKLRVLSDAAGKIYSKLIEKYDDLYADDLITEEEYIKADNYAEAQTNYKQYKFDLFNAETELLARYEQEIKDSGLYDNSVKELFSMAKKSVITRDKLINKILEIEGDI